MKGKDLERIVAEVPARLKRQAAAKAALEGRSLREVLIELLEKWLNEPERDREESALNFALN